MGQGIAGTVATTGEVVNVSNAYNDPRFSQDVDKNTGYNTNAMLTMPIKTTSGVIIAVVQFINKVHIIYYTSILAYYLMNSHNPVHVCRIQLNYYVLLSGGRSCHTPEDA